VKRFLIDTCKNYELGGAIEDPEHDENWHQEDNQSEAAADLYDAYKSWSAATGQGQLSRPKFYARLGRLSIGKRRRSDGQRYRVRLKPQRERYGASEDVV
jgi:phage/plasmid-associated DNA primase